MFLSLPNSNLGNLSDLNTDSQLSIVHSINEVENRSKFSLLANGYISDCLLINTNDKSDEYNKTYVVSDGYTSNLPNELAWGEREVLFVAANEVIVRVTGIKVDGTTPIIALNIYNNGAWTGWSVI